MDEKFANKMPPRRPHDHKIPLKEEEEPRLGPLYTIYRITSTRALYRSALPLLVPPSYLLKRPMEHSISALIIVALMNLPSKTAARCRSSGKLSTASPKSNSTPNFIFAKGITRSEWLRVKTGKHPFMFCTASLDDILIYSDTFEEHQFHLQNTTYLDLIIEPNSIKIDSRKVDKVKKWTILKTVKDVQAFLGFANFYRRFTGGFSELASLLTRLTRKDISFEWTPEAQTTFNALKEAFTTAPILTHFDLEKEISVETDASDYVSASVLFQYNDNGKQGGKPDALTRRSGDLPGEGDERQLHQSQVVLKKENLDVKLSLLAGSFSNEPTEKNPSLNRLFDEGYSPDLFPKGILDMRNKGERPSKDISLPECTEIEGRLLYRGSIYVPDYDPFNLRILQLYHDAASAGHPGHEKTFELISRDYYWPLMRNYIDRYIRNCHTSQRSKPNTHGKLSVLRPLPIPEQPLQEVSMDFVTGLPESEGYDAIMVVVDRLTKMQHLLPCNTTVNSEDIAQVYLRNIWKLHGLSTHVTSDRGTQFTAKFWRALCKYLDIEARMSTAFQLEIDSQTERPNTVMEQYLQFSVNNQVSTSTKATPFFANYGFHPRFTVTIKSLNRTPTSLNAKDFASKMKELHEHLRSNIRTAQDQQEQAVNVKRTPAPEYDISDMVFVSAKNI
ncbi:uncharacterized protein H6S33_008259 [Morchella sextelata]|uniref:uncharacterized protein n=1 Tax=Morchella sextelata TaxID=1174677 RepID=UPI001D0409AC|nr:uncharacterized protein H6S33_008259 [Morchella sextelata]KAH0603255.1 hypothetical protein H6S33_008259 [Morchella sextelata]